MSTPRRTLAEAADASDNGFNLVRLATALTVAYFHAYMTTGTIPALEPLGKLFSPAADTGRLSLAVFFLISGFFVTRSWINDPHLGRFAARRAARLLPALAVCVPLMTLCAVLFFSAPEAHGIFSRDTWQYILTNVGLHGLRFVIPDTEWHINGVLGGQAINAPLWTLFWEGRMYVMVALLGMAAALPLRQWFMGCAAFLLLATQLFPDVASGYVWETQLWSMFLVGMLCCTLAAQLRVGPVQVACAVVFVAINWTRTASMGPTGFTWFGLALVCTALALSAGSTRMQRWAYLRRHDYSYGIYLYHWPIMTMLKAAIPSMTALPMIAAGIGLTIPMAMLSWHLVEAPAMRAMRRQLSGRRLHVVETAVTDDPAWQRSGPAPSSRQHQN